jgi:hypothetical protein
MDGNWEILKGAPAVEGRYVYRAVFHENRTGKRIGPIAISIDADAWQEIEREASSQVLQNPGAAKESFRSGILVSFLLKQQSSGWNPEQNPSLPLSKIQVDEVLQPK